jgi:transposase
MPWKFNPGRTEMESIYRRVAGLDVHRMKHMATVLTEAEDGTLTKSTREFGAFRRDLRELVAWLQSQGVELVVMESTGIYWKSVFGHLEAAGIPGWVVNARHIKNVPGRKTDVADSEWLAQLGRHGLVRASFIPPKDLRELRLVSRYRRKMSGTLAAEKNRLHKLLDDAGIKLGAVVADINGVSARRMVEGLIAGKPPAELAGLALGPLKGKRAALEVSMEGELSARHRLVLEATQRHINYLEAELSALDGTLIEAMQPYAWAWRLLQTIPGMDEISATMILIEISDDLRRFGSAKRLASWAGLCPGNNESAGKRKSGKMPHGNPIVRTLLCEVANAARRTKSVFHAKYQSLVVRRGHKRTIIALAHKLLRTIFVLLTRREPYSDSSYDYESANVAKNAPRWISALVKFGYWPVVAKAVH